jgi:hypothetical protein
MLRLYHLLQLHRLESVFSQPLKATYDCLDTEGDEKTFLFYYILANETAFDYKADNRADVIVAAHLQEENALTVERDEGHIRIDYPLIVPAKQRVKFAIHLAYRYRGKETLNADASLEERKNYYKALADYVSKELDNLDGFLLFDKANRCQINFPKGW